ncbi:hypothetical protein V3851_15535 [Paenibacillus sp. M1]|uniref:SnoaL-like domain-containing protein n=1 Tax=Paenibacillus haidiansis TaxID=1574488 RepID=A0ABU7VU11_9BACL
MGKQSGWKALGIILLLVAGTLLHGSVQAEPNNSDKTTLDTETLIYEQVADWITRQGLEEVKELYLEALSYVEVQLDEDAELEVIAGIDGGVHLGRFFIFDQTSNGAFTLVAERDWKVEELDPGMEKDVELKKVFETVERTGGTGIDVYYAHLWYLENGEMKEAWQGTLKMRNAMLPGEHSLLAGGYQVIENTLYSWETITKLADDDETPLAGPETMLKVYRFDGSKFAENDN